MRRRLQTKTVKATNTYRVVDASMRPLPPWSKPQKCKVEQIVSVQREIPHTSRHCFSVCLYHEPEFERRFPRRDFRERYLEKMPQIREHLAAHNCHLKIFADETMLDTAMNFEFADVYGVRGEPAFPFYQHIYRYYAALLADHGTVEAYHFRGLDNLLFDPGEWKMFEAFRTSDCGIMHAPYLRANGKVYTPVRGSCSVARDGIAALAWFLRSVPHKAPRQDWPEPWHSDEAYLSRWFAQVKGHLALFTVVDRELPMDFFSDLHRQIQLALPLRLMRI